MNTHADKTQENKSQSVANAVAQKQGGGESTFQFVDNRPETIAQRKLQEMANNSPQIKQAAQLQTMANNYSVRQQQPIQKKQNKTGLPYNCKIANQDITPIPIQRMAAYDNENIDLINDPRHFSTAEIKQAIDVCITNGTPVPYWLKEQISGFLRDELLHRMNDMQWHGGGDQGHQYYFELVQGYVDKIDSLPVEEDPQNQVPMDDGPVAQLRRESITGNHSTHHQQPVQEKENNTGLPDNLKSGIENLSGYSMDDVEVHRNSDKPAQLQAHAYAQGTDIHIAPGQEKHLPHEAWHVVQQKQGRVKPTMQMKGKVNINNDVGLEREADVMGEKAVQRQTSEKTNGLTKFSPTTTIQRASFFVGINRFKTQDLTYDQLSSILSEMQEKQDTTSISSLRDACVKELKKLTDGSKVSQLELGKLLNIIDGVQEKEPEKRVSTAETSKMLASHQFKDLSERIGILNNEKIDYWIHKDNPLPESNVKGEIAEELTQRILVEAEKNVERIVLSSVKIVIDNGPDAKYRYTEKADLDHLVVAPTRDGWIPVEIFETKAGAEGEKTGQLTTKLSGKLKELNQVVGKSYKIMSKGSNITNKFNLSILGSSKIDLFTSGIFPTNNIQLNESEIVGIFNYLQIVQQHYVAYKNEW
ncbi:MAG: DUF4157 domain-containing protein [Candidatus Electrothrix communis]|nr:MAG: DUF4157 domain-containing protein [Candidatus Electrothrix communis]